MDVFLREEQKYLISKDLYNKLITLLRPYLKKDTYYNSKIYNIYFDTKGNDLVINSIDKPPFKDKIRLRSYGVPDQEDVVFLEIKRKYNDVVNKRRVAFSLNNINYYLDTNKLTINNQIMREIDYYFNYYHLEKAFFIAYDRKAYTLKEDNLFRITFDYNLRYRTSKLELKDANIDKYYLKDYYIMEIKSNGGMPLWFTKMLSYLKIYPTSFSKYGEIYKHLKGDEGNV